MIHANFIAPCFIEVELWPSEVLHRELYAFSNFFAPVTLTLTRWLSYTKLTGLLWRYNTGYVKINFLRQVFRKLSFLANVNSCHCPSVCRLSVCLSSVTLVHPTQAIENFGNVSSPLDTMAICLHPGKILRRSSQSTPWSGELNTRGVAEYSDFGPIERYIPETVQDKAKLVLVTNRKSHELSTGTKLGDLGWL